ncbi:Nucleic-acid-binding protein from transposon X-element [Eumeta japonica]|uniref:Nucleic-acid-binding protein from transposon X-element n=1 Tax=Eumeta variegata TaxID=151549 RepID=A0A4C1XVQ4_EUMVA|nr:Nucleic-acid-binding protein from transposon X-element [Eumeta japonica]
MSRAVDTHVCRPAALGEAIEVVRPVARLSHTTYAYGREDVQDRHFIPPPRRKWETKKKLMRRKESSVFGSVVGGRVRPVTLTTHSTRSRRCSSPSEAFLCVVRLREVFVRRPVAPRRRRVIAAWRVPPARRSRREPPSPRAAAAADARGRRVTSQPPPPPPPPPRYRRLARVRLVSGQERSRRVPVTRALIKDILLKSLADMGYECPEGDLDKFVRKTTPVSSRASSQATSPASSQNSSRSHSPVKGKNKRKARSSSSSEEETTSADSDSTVVGTDESESDSGKSTSKSDTSFTLVKGKTKKEIRKALKKSKLECSSPVRDMEVEISQKVKPTPAITVADPPSPRPVTTSTQVATDRVANTGAKPSAPPKGKAPPPIYLLKGANFVRISADCTRLRINYSKAVRVADDGIKITCPDVETFRSLNKYLIDSKVKFHTYALEEERKVKAVIRGIPADFNTDDIKSDLLNQGFPVQSVHRLCRRDGSPLWLVLAVLPRTEEARSIFVNLSKFCGLSGIRVEAPRSRGGPGQCHRCQRYGHAAANCHADPRCVKCLVPHWTRECPRTRDSGEKPECVNCGQLHMANYRGCPKAPKFAPPKQKRSTNNRPSRASEGLIRNDANFPELRAKPSRDAPAAFRLAPAPPTNPWTTRAAQPPSATSRPHREAQPGTAPSIRDRGFIIVWRRYSNGDGRSPRGFELGDRRVRESAPSVPQRGGKTPRSS